MKKYILVLSIASLFACQQNKQASKQVADGKDSPELLDTLHLALDWTPNVLHAGIFWAESQDWFKKKGIYLRWDTPEIDNYTKKPVLRLLDGEVDLAIGPSEHLFAFAADSNGLRAQAVATILQADRSAFVLMADAQVESPAEIKEKTYLGYHTPLEHEILDAMIENAGGQAAYQTHEPGRLAVWDAFMQDSGQVAWVFLHWEAILAQRAGLELTSFIPNNYGVPYGYSSVIMAPTQLTEKKQESLKRFLKVLDQAYRAVAANPQAAAQNLRANYEHANFKDSAFVNAAMADISPYFLDAEKGWGQMKAEKWEAYYQWMEERSLAKLSDTLLAEIFSNEYLPN